MPITEIVSFSTSDAYRADQSILSKTVDILANAKGHINTYHGLQIEDPNVGYLIVVWDTYEDHQALMSAPVYPELRASLNPARTGSSQMLHVAFTTDPTPALSAPVTEVEFFTAHPERDPTPYLDAATKLDVGALISAAWGPTREKEELFVMLAGWETVEAHYGAVKEPNENIKAVDKALRETSTFHVAHAKLAKF